MNYRFVLFYVAFSLFSSFIFAQKETNIWYFGANAGLDFNISPPNSLTNGALNTMEGCATVCDRQGRLRFYTDGISVWNANHQVMLNGFGLYGGWSSTQSAIIVPWPLHDSLYFIFTTDVQARPNGLSYSIVNINHMSGLGDVITKNVQLHTPTCEKITAVMHANGRDVWVLSHKWGNDEFYTYLISPRGIQGNPLIQSIGSTYSGAIGNSQGYMKTSIQGNKLAIVSMRIFPLFDAVQVFDFDNSSGNLSNPITITQNLGIPYGLEFSPSERFLYVSDGPWIYQFDLDLPTQAQINQSSFRINNNFSSFGALQLTPDFRIFSSNFNQPYLSGIEYPDSLGARCSFKDTVILLAGGNGLAGLPGLIPPIYADIRADKVCIGDTTSFSLHSSYSKQILYFGILETA